jgi:hypothetical protein
VSSDNPEYLVIQGMSDSMQVGLTEFCCNFFKILVFAVNVQSLNQQIYIQLTRKWIYLAGQYWKVLC